MKQGMEKKIYTAPGTLTYTGEQTGNTEISVIQYNDTDIIELKPKNISEIAQIMDYKGTVYIEVNNVCDVSVVQSLGNMLNLHRIVLEDILSVNQRAKVEEYSDYLYMYAYGMRNHDTDSASTINISLILKNNIVVAFIDGSGDYFSSVKNRIHENAGIVRSMGPDYLFYILTDTIIDSYYGYLRMLDEASEEIENGVMSNTDSNILDEIYKIKRQLILVKKNTMAFAGYDTENE